VSLLSVISRLWCACVVAIAACGTAPASVDAGNEPDSGGAAPADLVQQVITIPDAAGGTIAVWFDVEPQGFLPGNGCLDRRVPIGYAYEQTGARSSTLQLVLSCENGGDPACAPSFQLTWTSLTAGTCVDTVGGVDTPCTFSITPC